MDRNGSLPADIKEALPSKMNAEFDRLADLVGEFMHYWGFKKIHGQIWLHIFLSDRPIDASTLVKRLRVSKALVSLAVKDLIQHNVIQPCAKGHKRTVYFRSNPNIMQVITDVLKNRERRLFDKIQEAIANIKTKKNPSLSSERVAELEEMVCSASDLLNVIIACDLSVDAVPKE